MRLAPLLLLAALPLPAIAQSARMRTAGSLDELPVAAEDWLIREPATRAHAWILPERRELVLDNGLVRRGFRLAPALATVTYRSHADGHELLRRTGAEATVTLDGVEWSLGGLTGQANPAFLRAEELDGLRPLPRALRLVGVEARETSERMPWARPRHHAPGADWPPPGVHLVLRFAGAVGEGEEAPAVEVRLHQELLDGLPVFTRWLEVANTGDAAVRVDGFRLEQLAVTEEESRVEAREGVHYPPPSRLHVETEMAFGGMSVANSSRHTVRWLPDPEYSSQVSYLRVTPCLLEVAPELGPAVEVEPGGRFTSFRAVELIHDSSDRERRGLTRRRALRALAPWVTENPLMHHLRVSDEASVRRAIEDAAEVGFEVVILSFGSGFDMETEDPEVIARWRALADLAHESGVELGGYSLLASRSISPEDDVVLPEGERPTFGSSPCLGSAWGQRYFAKLYAFLEATGFDLLEHDGNYPGDPCHSTGHPGHRGLEDSVWTQWRTITDLYRWCRERGVSLNVPDHYYLAGSTKSGMGYREVNWSLPRADQLVHTRQNIHDGTWEKTPSMGWMFVPLSEYHGGGAAATIEPLDEHLEHYRAMLRTNLALGVQACFRGPRLFDTERVREMVREEVAWFREHREVLEADLVHGRRADGRDVDWMLHVNPFPSSPDGERGMLVAFNPLEVAATRTLRVPLYYAGLEGEVRARIEGGEERTLPLGPTQELDLELTVPARGMLRVSLR